MFLSDDDMVECPYNKTHRMLRRRLQTHLHKCRLNYPDVELRKCPFNTTHLIPEPEFAHHATNCPDRKLITQYKYDAPEPKEEEVQKHAPIECDEDWDDTNVNDYNPQKYLENAQIIRKPDGASVSERKKFIKKERKRLGDDSSEDENTQDEDIKGKSTSFNNYKKFGKKDEDYDSEEGHILKPYGSKRSESPSSSCYSKQRSRSPHERTEKRRRSDSKDCSFHYSTPPNTSSSRRDIYSYNIDQDPYYNGGRCEEPSNISNVNEQNNLSMPEAPPPPMISYPIPRSYSTAKYPPSNSRY